MRTYACSTTAGQSELLLELLLAVGNSYIVNIK